MANTVLTYDPKQFSMICGDKIIGGFADDDFIEVERDEDAFSKKAGVDGIVTRAKNNVRMGKITIRIMQSSPSNDDLTAFAKLDEATPPAGSFAATARDGSGRSAFSAQTAWIKKLPKTVFKKDIEMREWVIDCGSLDVSIGGN